MNRFDVAGKDTREALDALSDEGFIHQSKRAKSVYLTVDGVKKAEQLRCKYKIGDTR